MNDDPKEYISLLHSIFEKQFTAVYQKSSAKYRARILPYIASIYRRWYYSALVEETLLTPANLTETINRALGQPHGASPVIRLKSERRYTGFKIAMLDYTTDNHHVVTDLKRLINYCLPDIDLNEEDTLSDSQSAELAAELTQWDMHYATYLLDVAIHMNLITKIPSIYANRAQVSRDYKERLDQPDGVLFAEIVETTIHLAVNALNGLIALPEPVFSEGFIRSILKKPMETDEIFQRVYGMMGFTLEDLLEQEFDDEFDGMDTAFLSSTFMLGVFIDRYFFTPLGHYLKLIRPIYIMPFDFQSEIKYFMDGGFDADEIFMAFFAPCSRYYLTELGLQYFNVKPNAHNFVDVKKKLPFDSLKEQLFVKTDVLAGMPAQGEYAITPTEGRIFTVKIKSEANPALWLNLEFPADATLHRLYLEAVAYFDLIKNLEYSFFHDQTENPFAEYVSPVKSKRAKKTADIPLEMLDFKHKRMLILAAYNQHAPSSRKKEAGRQTVKFTLEIMNEKPREAGNVYPVAVRISKALRNMNEEDFNQGQ